jgi:hypothetical protein
MFKLLPRICKNLQNGSIEGVSIEKARKKQTFHELTQPYKRQKSLSNLGSRDKTINISIFNLNVLN